MPSGTCDACLQTREPYLSSRYEALRGIDSQPGRITKKAGLQISYDIGRVTPPGQPRTGGSFFDHAKRLPETARKWFKTKKAGKRAVHIALGENNILYASVPSSGVNFSVKVKNEKESDEAIAIILSYREK